MNSGCDVCHSPYRDRGWRDQIGAASLDRYRGHPTAERTCLPDAIRVLDAFHVVRLTGDQAVNEVRLVQQILGLRDHPE